MNAYDQEDQSLRRNHLLFNPETCEWVEFFTLKISAGKNDVIHNDTGPAVRFGRARTPATSPETPNPQPDSMPTAMSNRYKIFQVERSQFGPLPGEVCIELGPNTISVVLSDELQCAEGSTTFGVECDTFAWFEDGPFITLILREEDPHFNIDLAMTQLANLPGKEGIDFFGVIEARITRRKCPLDAILRKRGFRPVSVGGILPHQGMGGTVYRGDSADPVFAAPPLPTLVGQPGDADFDGLIDVWFRQLQTILEKLKGRFGNIKLVFEHGNVPVPAWFMDWCTSLGIDVEFVEGEGAGNDFISNDASHFVTQHQLAQDTAAHNVDLHLSDLPSADDGELMHCFVQPPSPPSKPVPRVSAAKYTVAAFGRPGRVFQAILGSVRQKPSAEDQVNCGIFAPPEAKPGDTFMVQAFSFLLEDADQAARMAREFDDAARPRGVKTLDVRVPLESKILFHLVIPGMRVDDALQSIVWWGRTQSVNFAVKVPDEMPIGVVIGSITVCLGNVPVGCIKFKVEVKNHVSTVQEPRAEFVATKYKKAFVSYASADKTEVMKRVQMLNKVGVHHFCDVLDLEPGEAWEKIIKEQIAECDLFLLFWSTAARDSEWVTKEVTAALARKGGDDYTLPDIVPVIIEGPPIVAPPAELAHLHFNDRVLYFMSKSH
ncbi:MAG: toll/interleukin-1 receptor domain-containing protein [Verrucomicrobiota bacterium]